MYMKHRSDRLFVDAVLTTEFSMSVTLPAKVIGDLAPMTESSACTTSSLGMRRSGAMKVGDRTV